jgi:hypothetical protein
LSTFEQFLTQELATIQSQTKRRAIMRSATATRLSRRASLVESSEQVRIETAVLAEIKKGLFSIKEAILAGDESERSAARFDATAAYENARSLLDSSPFPITEHSIQEKLRLLETAVRGYLLLR